MLNPGVAAFLQRARSDSSLMEQVKRSDCYQALEDLSERTGTPVMAADLRAAFVKRNAGALTQQMIRHGVLEPLPLPKVPALDAGLWSRVAAMNLSPVADQLVQYQGWTTERVVSAEQRYRRFFYLKAVLPKGMASPTEEIDQFWHQHIINTQRYGCDCERVAERFLHHTFLSPTDPVQQQEIHAVWLATWICYEGLFEEPYEETIGAALLDRWPST